MFLTHSGRASVSFKDSGLVEFVGELFDGMARRFQCWGERTSNLDGGMVENHSGGAQGMSGDGSVDPHELPGLRPGVERGDYGASVAATE
ncbi:MAG: hypothetical protein ACPGVG_18125 [Mycobacterium sp.]